jgi:Ca2+-binding RTX toxin-like protein
VTIQAIDSDGDGLREAITDRTGRIIDGNRDGIADAEQAHVTGLRLMSDGAFSTDYGAVAVSDGVILSDAHCITPSDNGHFSVITRNGDTVQAALPYGVTDRFIGAVSFTLSGIAAGATTTATIHLPSGLSENPNTYIRFNYLTNQFEEYTDAQGKPLYALIDNNSDGLIDAIELTLTDGDLRWDRDGVANGIIEDPGFAASAERVIRGEQTDDDLIGNVLANTLIGRQGNDVLIGDLGNDRIRGGVGNDLLLGGRGSDTLKGGPGNDRYVFEQASDSAPGLRDRAYFGQGDRFDLRAIDANINLDGQQTFQFINNAAFTGIAGELRASRSVLQADLNGDAVADFSVQLHSGIRLSAANLML